MNYLIRQLPLSHVLRVFRRSRPVVLVARSLRHHHGKFIANNYRPRPLSRQTTSLRHLLLGGVLGVLFGSEDEDGKVPNYIKQQLVKAQRALRNGDYDTASKAYHRALKRLAASQYSQTQSFIEARAVVLDKMANMYLQQGLLKEAEVAFKETMKSMLTAGVTQESAEMVEISLKLSKIYTNLNKHKLAENGFFWCVTTAEQLCTVSRTNNNLALWGMCLQSKGQYHMSRGEWKLAIACLRKSLELCEEITPNSPQQVGVLHNDLATALDAGGEVEEAEFHVRSSIRVLSDISSSSEYLARVYYNLGIILKHQGKNLEAKDTLNSALEMAKRSRNEELMEMILRA